MKRNQNDERAHATGRSYSRIPGPMTNLGRRRCPEEVVLIPAIDGRPVISRADMAARGVPASTVNGWYREAAWLLDLLPEYRQYPTIGRHTVVLAYIARHVLNGAVEGARQGYRTTRS